MSDLTFKRRLMGMDVAFFFCVYTAINNSLSFMLILQNIHLLSGINLVMAIFNFCIQLLFLESAYGMMGGIAWDRKIYNTLLLIRVVYSFVFIIALICFLIDDFATPEQTILLFVQFFGGWIFYYYFNSKFVDDFFVIWKKRKFLFFSGRLIQRKN